MKCGARVRSYPRGTRAAPKAIADRSMKPREVRGKAANDNLNPMASSQMLVIVPPHPLVGHWVAVARNKYSPTPMFRNALAELGRILIYEAVREWLPVVEAQLETPLAVADVSLIDAEKPIKVRKRVLLWQVFLRHYDDEG